jgi:uncharacterized protein YhaN
MFIKDLNLKSFGKFQHKNVVLQNGLNLICGKNEAGKSTVHNFVETMLYGFKNDKNKYDESLFKKYRPWSYDQFKGSMIIENGDSDYIIRKDFLDKNTSFTKKNVSAANEEAIPGFSADMEVGEYLFDINKSAFSNTLSIKQLSNSTNEELATQVKERILNLSQTKDESISIEKINRKLNSIKNEAGDINNPKSILSQYIARVSELNQTRDKSIDARQYTLHLAMEKRKLENKISDVNRKISDINKELDIFKLSILSSKKQKADEVYKEINAIKEELSHYGEGNDIGIDEYEEAVKLLTILKQMRDEKALLEEEILSINTEMVKLENDPSCSISADGFVVKINLDYKSYIEGNEKIDKLQEKVKQGIEHIKAFDTDEIAEYAESYDIVSSNEQKVSRLNNLLNDSSKSIFKKLIKSLNIKKTFLIIFAILFLTAAGASTYAGYYFDIVEYYFGASIALISLILFGVLAKTNKKIKGLKTEVRFINEEQDKLKLTLQSCKAESNNILDEKGCETIAMLKDKCEYYISLKAVIEEKIKLLEYDKDSLKIAIKSKKILEDDLLNKLSKFNLYEITDASIQKLNEIVLEKDKVIQELTKKSALLDKLSEKYQKLSKDLDFEEKRFNVILSSNNINNIEEFKVLINNNYKIAQLKDKVFNLERIIESILEGYTYDEITQKTKELLENESKNEDAKRINQEEKLKEIHDNEEEKAVLIKEINKIENEIDSIEDITKHLSEIEEEIDFYNDKIEQNNEKIMVADLAIENINLISDYIKGDFMPLLRSAISENFSYVTGGRYSGVNIDEDMNISVVMADSTEEIDINSLSGGTLDQLYISVRLGFSSLISNNKKIPLILDDSFIQYDEERLEKSLEILDKEKNRRQIILFSCQKREKQILDKLRIEHNYIEIN